MEPINHHGLISLILMASLACVGAAAPAGAQTHPSNRSSQLKAADIVRDPSDLPPPVGNRAPGVVHVTLTAQEVVGVLDSTSGTTYRYWTFNGKVPGPFIRVRQGDMVVLTLNNDRNDTMVHSIDLHAALGPGGGAAMAQVPPGQSKTFSFKATVPGLFVYHCGTPMVAEHIANGMYGLILVEPPGGLPHVDHEYYIMQGEIYTTAPKGKSGLQQFSGSNLMNEAPEYFVYNGAVDALSSQYPLQASVGQTVRIFFGNAGPNATGSEHIIGEIFSRVYLFGSLTSVPLTGVQTAGVPPGDAAILELKTEMPGKFTLMDHAMARMQKGLMAILDVKGPDNLALMHEGPTPVPPGTTEISGITAADLKAATESPALASVSGSSSGPGEMEGMDMTARGASPVETLKAPAFSLREAIDSSGSLVGCLTQLNDGKVLLRVFHSRTIIRLEAQPFQFAENLDHLVHVTGQFGSVVAEEDPHIPSFVVDDVDSLAPTCSRPMPVAELRKDLEPPTAPIGAVVTMETMWFTPATVTITVGEQVVWKNTSTMYHNVVDDPAKAGAIRDVSYPAGTSPFSSHLLGPGTDFDHVFDKPGIYHYVCTLHEWAGMKGTVIVKPESMVAASASVKQAAGQ